MSLYAIANDYRQAINDAMLEDEVSLEQVDLLNKLEGSLEDKAIAIATFIKNIESDADSIARAINDMEKRKESLEDHALSLKKYLHTTLEACKIKEITKSPYFTIKIKTNPPRVNIDDATLIPQNYIKIKTESCIDKTYIMNELKEGKVIPGATLIQQTRLEIK